jgi:hypothetical protein
MVAPTAAAATGIYAVRCQTMVAYLAAAYTVEGDSVHAASCIHLFYYSSWNLKI